MGSDQQKSIARRWALGALAAFVAVGALGLWTLIQALGPLDVSAAARGSTIAVDREGRLLRAFTAPDGRWRLPVEVGDVDPRFFKLLMAYEDRRFRSHHGVDPLAMARAAGQMARNGRVVSGASTLTMQVARLLEPRDERTLAAKLRQMVRAVQLERAYGKDEILGFYLALAPYGGNLEGVRAASLAYFGKEPRRLSDAEAALLVALPQAPEARRPDRAPETARRARDRVLDRAMAKGALSEAEAMAAKADPVPQVRAAFPMLAPHATEAGLRATPGLRVQRYAFDARLQAGLEALARDSVARLGPKLSIAMVAIDNASGEVRAHVGGADYLSSERAGGVDLALAVRSPGSALKPFIYLLAFEAGVAHPETMLEDRRARFGLYAPENFDLTFQGQVTARAALQNSLNIPAIALLNEVGPATFLARLRNAGAEIAMPDDSAPGLAIGLGGLGIRLTDLTRLYAGLARAGRMPGLVERLDQSRPMADRRIAEPVPAWYVYDVLRGAPPPDHALGGRIAFKTGTSYGYRDAWAVGYDGTHTIAVWVGRPDGAAVPGVVGRLAAAPILFEAFQRIGPNRTPLDLAPPGTVIARTNELPAALQRFRPDSLPEVATSTQGDAPPAIAFPPDGARIDLAGDVAPALSLKVYGGTPPFTWLADGIPIAEREFRRDAFWDQPAHGFARLSVIDAKGKTATARIRVE